MILNELTSVPSSAIPVTAFSEHLNLGSGFSDSGDQDSILETYLRAALAAIEARLGIALFRRRFSWGLYAWSNPNTQRLPVSPVQARAFRICRITEASRSFLRLVMGRLGTQYLRIFVKPF